MKMNSTSFNEIITTNLGQTMPLFIVIFKELVMYTVWSTKPV